MKTILLLLSLPLLLACKQRQPLEHEAETQPMDSKKNAALSLDEQYPLPPYARESLEKLQARVIFDGIVQPGETRRFENFGEVQSIGYFLDTTVSETPHRLSFIFSSLNGGWFRSDGGSRLTPAEPPVKSGYIGHNDGPTPRRILVYTTPMEEPVKVSKLTSATLRYKDADKGNMAKISKLIHSYAADGATTVNFPGGKWQWHDLSQLELPADAQKSLEIPLENLQLEALDKQVRDWISTEQIKAVQISIDPQAPAKLFFSIEHVLSERKTPYALLDGTERSQGKILLQQTDGKARVIRPDR